VPLRRTGACVRFLVRGVHAPSYNPPDSDCMPQSRSSNHGWPSPSRQTPRA
jgi:hypothetical protein